MCGGDRITQPSLARMGWVSLREVWVPIDQRELWDGDDQCFGRLSLSAHRLFVTVLLLVLSGVKRAA